MSNSCLMLLEFLIVDDFFLNFDALTHLFLQPLACIAEFQLRGRAGRVVYHGYIQGWAWKLRVRGGDGFGSDGIGGDRVRHLSPCSSNNAAWSPEH